MNGIIEYNSITGQSDEIIEIDLKEYGGFYISYNSYDRDIYGDVTTALVLGQMQGFFILNGNHTKQYKKLIEQGVLK